ncbi:MarR family transcriptional regulator [Candidatus Pacearchaeota archaeon]|nr:MarR family transcriptional regulator [Candidatus Pacearchaeota archaeon]
MENKNVGYLILGISILMIVIIFLFNNALKDIVGASCSAAHGIDSCPMYDTITKQTYLSLAVVGIIIIISLVLIFSKPRERIIIRKVKEKEVKRKINLSGLRNEDKNLFKIIEENDTIFQADLIEKSGFGKAKVSRILDRLENKGLVERKRRGMTNIVILKK